MKNFKKFVIGSYIMPRNINMVIVNFNKKELTILLNQMLEQMKEDKNCLPNLMIYKGSQPLKYLEIYEITEI